MGIVEKIKDIGTIECAGLCTHRAYDQSEAEISRTQKNKATEGHLGLLKAKLAKLRSEVW